MTHAERELEILFKTTPDAIIREFKNEIIALIDKFNESGQSGGSAPYVAGAISQAVNNLCLQQTIAPLTGEDDEWIEVSDRQDGESWYQNNRNSAVFKDSKDGQAYYIDAVIFDGDKTGTYTGNGSVRLSNKQSIGSLQYIKSFPFTPKSFYIDTIETEWADKYEKVEQEGGGWWTSKVKDESQLEEVWNYYDKKENNDN